MLDALNVLAYSGPVVGKWNLARQVRVTCPIVRTDDNYEQVDRAINDALVAHFEIEKARG